jgi:hypothetical protein
LKNASRAAEPKLDLASWRPCMGVMGCAVWGRLTGRSAAVVRDPAMGRSVPCLVRRVLAGARTRFLGRHVRGAGLPTASRRIAAQRLVPDDRNRSWSGSDCRSDVKLSAKSCRLPPESRVVGRSLCTGSTLLRNFAAYAAALAGFTAAIIAGDELGAVGGANRSRSPSRA